MNCDFERKKDPVLRMPFIIIDKFHESNAELDGEKTMTFWNGRKSVFY